MDRFKFNENIKSNEIAFQMGGFFRMCKCNKDPKNNLHQTEKNFPAPYFKHKKNTISSLMCIFHN